MEDAQNASLSTIMDLADDCLVFIFKRLSCESDRKAFGLTCHKWLEIQNQNRQSLEFDCSLIDIMVPESGTFYKIDTYKLHRTLTRFPNLKSLSVYGCSELTDSGLSLLQNYGASLRSLHLDCCYRITDSSLSFVASGCPSLKFISLYRCNVTDTGLETLAKGCLGLEVVNLAYCSFITDKGIKAIVQNCFQLLAIRIGICEGITGAGFQGCSQNLAYLEADFCNLQPEGILAIVSGGGLKYLNIANLNWSVCGDGLPVIGAGFASRLRFLNTRLCRIMTDESVAVIAKGCPSLVEWNLTLCHEIGFVGWESIAFNCHNLEKLHVSKCRNLCDRGLQALGSGCKKLSILYMKGCPRVTTFAVECFRLYRNDIVIKREESFDLPSDFREIMYSSHQ